MTVVQEEIAAAFGGDKQSGYGREVGPCDIDVCPPTKSVQR